MFSLTISSPLPDPQPLAMTLIDPDTLDFSFTTQLQAGFAALQVSWQPGHTPRSIGKALRSAEIRAFGDVTLKAGTNLIWRGQIDETMRHGSEPNGFTAEGYGTAAARDLPFRSKDDESEHTTGQALRHILSQTAPLLVAGNSDQFQDPGVSPAYLSEFDEMFAGEAINQIVRQGGTDGNIWDYAVWENRTAHLKPRIAPDVADYIIPDDQDVESSERYDELWGRVQVRYTDATSGEESYTPVFEDPTFKSRYGRWREKIIDGGKLSQTAAQRYAQTYLQQHKTPQTAYRVTRRSLTGRSTEVVERGLEAFGQIEIPAWLVRAGQWLQVGDNDPLIILSTDFSLSNGAVSLDVGSATPDFAEAFRNIEDNLAAYRRKINPLTGGKDR